MKRSDDEPSHPRVCAPAEVVIAIDSVQAEYVRVPFADTSTHKVPEGLTDEQVVYLADILPTGHEVGVLNGHV